MTKTSKDLSSLLAISRHQGLTILFISQHCLPLNILISTPNGNRKLEDLRTGDEVLSLGKNGVEKKRIIVSKPRKKTLWRIYLDDNSILECSGEHKWFTDCGLIPTELLITNHKLFKPVCSDIKYAKRIFKESKSNENETFGSFKEGNKRGKAQRSVEERAFALEHWKEVVRRNKEKDIGIGKRKIHTIRNERTSERIHAKEQSVQRKASHERNKRNPSEPIGKKMAESKIQKFYGYIRKKESQGNGKSKLERWNFRRTVQLPLQIIEKTDIREGWMEMPDLRCNGGKRTEEKRVFNTPYRLQQEESGHEESHNSLSDMSFKGKFQQGLLGKHFIPIVRIEETNKTVEMKDITVENNHNFFLANGILSSNSGLVDLNILRMADLFIFKKLSWEEMYGRNEKRTDRLLRFVRMMQPKTEKDCLFTDGEKWYTLQTALPTFWSETISKTYKKLSKKEAVSLARKMYDTGTPLRIICKQLLVRGVNWTEQDVQYFIGRGKYGKKK
jgi:hypothetical protein